MVHSFHSFTIKKAPASKTDALQNLLKMIYYLKQGDSHLCQKVLGGQPLLVLLVQTK